MCSVNVKTSYRNNSDCRRKQMKEKRTTNESTNRSTETIYLAESICGWRKSVNPAAGYDRFD